MIPINIVVSELHENDYDYITGRGKDKVFKVTSQKELNDFITTCKLLTSFMKKSTIQRMIL